LPFLDFLSPQYLPPEGVSINEKYDQKWHTWV
jgi:hypothetical protein